MRWTERQRAMLEAMGLRVWPHGAVGDPAPPAATAPAVARLAETPPGDPLEAELAQLDWPELEARAASCRACSLCVAGTHGVPGAGHRQAEWMIVGGAPEAADEAAGTPFAGRSGELLDNMLRPLGLARAATETLRRPWVTFAVKCRAPGERAPEAAEIARCAPFLRREVELVRPRLILALGRTAAHALLARSEAPGRLRGRVHRCADIPVVVTHEPAFLLRQPRWKAEAWEDLCLALEVLSL